MRYSLVVNLYCGLPKRLNMFHPCRLAALALVVVSFSACKVESLDDPIIVPVVDQEFAFDLWQNLASTSMSPLEVRMYTLEDYECLNTSILTNYLRVGRNLELTLFDILDPEVCDAGLGPATGVEVLDNIEEDLYRLKIELQDVVQNDGWLTVTADSYTVEMEQENGISWQHYEMRRIPEEAFWGYITYPDAASQLQAETFLSDLQQLGTVADLQDGYYGHYSLSDNGTKVDVNTTSLPGQAITFLFEYTGENAEIDQRVEAFLMDADPELQLHFWNGKGDEWRR